MQFIKRAREIDHARARYKPLSEGVSKVLTGSRPPVANLENRENSRWSGLAGLRAGLQRHRDHTGYNDYEFSLSLSRLAVIG